ncbi:MAG: phosphodiester glycosidase family protein [Thermostichales cyanobacterium HHBFW_bins_127]
MVRILGCLLGLSLWAGAAWGLPHLELKVWGSQPVRVVRLPSRVRLQLLKATDGLQPLENLALGMPIAINGGFFNRLTQQPLGALRWQGQWWSSPILGRGVLAWNDQGEMRISRLRWRGQVRAAGMDPIPVLTLNSGYVVPGVAAYTHHWGSRYVAQTDEELVALMEQDRVVALYPTGRAGGSSFPLSRRQWLLVARGWQAWQRLQDLSLGSQVVWSEQFDPPELEDFPHLLGAGPLLVAEGRVVLDAEWERFQPAFARQRAARSALCLDNSLSLISVGASQESLGLTLAELANFLQQQGCRFALNLDGGSSTTLIWQGQTLTSGSRIHNGLGVVP